MTLVQPRPLKAVLRVGYKRFFWICYKREKKWVTIWGGNGFALDYCETFFVTV